MRCRKKAVSAIALPLVPAFAISLAAAGGKVVAGAPDVATRFAAAVLKALKGVHTS